MNTVSKNSSFDQDSQIKWMNGMEDHKKSHPDKKDGGEVGPSESEASIPKSSEKCSSENRYVDITAMIRSLQRTEGSKDCFRRGIADCDQLSCTWRQYCLQKSE